MAFKIRIFILCVAVVLCTEAQIDPLLGRLAHLLDTPVSVVGDVTGTVLKTVPKVPPSLEATSSLSNEVQGLLDTTVPMLLEGQIKVLKLLSSFFSGKQKLCGPTGNLNSEADGPKPDENKGTAVGNPAVAEQDN